MFFTTKGFWTDLAERTVSSFAQGAITVVTLDSFNVIQVDSLADAGVAGLSMAVLALLKCFALARPQEENA